jgi:hypothetical protein
MPDHGAWFSCWDVSEDTIVVSKHGMLHRAGCPHLRVKNPNTAPSVVRMPTGADLDDAPGCSNKVCWG